MLNDLDAMRLSIAKSINDAEGVLTSKESELAGLKDECSKLEASDPAAEHELDATAYALLPFPSASIFLNVLTVKFLQAQTRILQRPWVRTCHRQGRTR